MSDKRRHSRAVWLFVLAAFLWSIAGPVTRYLNSAASFEVTFWRSVFAAMTVLTYSLLNGKGNPLLQLRATGVSGLVSGLMWSIMFCCFMIALTLTTAANVLLVQSVAPILTAVLASIVFRTALGWRTWLVILITCLAIAAMYVQDVSSLGGRHTVGVLIALGVPCAAAINWVTQQKATANHRARLDLTSSVMLGAVMSSLVMLPLAFPFQASFHDLGLLAFLGVFQLGIPCIIVVRVMDRLLAHEASLLGLLEVIFGIALAWLFVSEKPGMTTLVSGSVVIAALVYNEMAAAVRTRAPANHKPANHIPE
jgi:drug/metabolite transporter (DMT)-like permease